MDETRNVFQIWKDIEEKLPFAVRRKNWTEEYYAVVERIEIRKWPYGTAWGYATENGAPSNHFLYDSAWRKDFVFPNAGSYQWYYLENPTGFERLIAFDSREAFTKWFSLDEINAAANKRIICGWDKEFYLNVRGKKYLTDKQLTHKYRINILMHDFTT